jgi:hypothetical protein
VSSISARYFNPLRIAAYVLVLYCLGHTSGALLSTPAFGAEANAVLSAMKSVHFACESSDCTWFGFYLGFGWFVSILFLLSAAVAWFLGGLDARDQRVVAPIAWVLFLAHAAGIVLAWRYFFLTPLIFSTLTTVLLGFHCVRVMRANDAAAGAQRP